MKKIFLLFLIFFPALLFAQKTKKALHVIATRANYSQASKYLNAARKAGKDSTKYSTLYNYTWGIYYLQNTEPIERDTLLAKRYFLASKSTFNNRRKRESKILNKYQIDERRINEKLEKCGAKISNDIISRKDSSITILERDIATFNNTLASINDDIISHQQKLIGYKRSTQDKLRVQVSLNLDTKTGTQAYHKVKQALREKLPAIKNDRKKNLKYNYKLKNSDNGFSLNFDIELSPSNESLKLKEYKLGIYKSQLVDNYIAEFSTLLTTIIKETSTPIVFTKIRGTIIGMADGHKLKKLKYKGELGHQIHKINCITNNEVKQISIKKGDDLRKKGGNTTLAFLRAYNAGLILSKNLSNIPNVKVAPFNFKAVTSHQKGGAFRNVSIILEVDFGKKDLLEKIDYISQKIKENKKLIIAEQQAVEDAKALKRGMIQNNNIAKHRNRILKYKSEIDALMDLLDNRE